MRTHEFLSKLDSSRIVEAIQAAESKTSGEIRVYVQRGNLPGDPVIAAQKRFHKLGMEKTSHRNGVLIFVAPRVQKYAVFGDEGVFKKCGPECWQRIVDSVRGSFQEEHFNRALITAIKHVGELLADHFPKKGGGPNELADEVVES
jgi:uncharacterized membrane protein